MPDLFNMISLLAIVGGGLICTAVAMLSVAVLLLAASA